MLDIVDRERAILAWNGIDYLSKRKQRRGDKNFAGLFALGRRIEATDLADLGAPRPALTGGYGFRNRLIGGTEEWAGWLNSIRPRAPARQPSVRDAIVTIHAIDEHARESGAALSLAIVTTLAFFVRPDLPVIILGSTRASGGDIKENLRTEFDRLNEIVERDPPFTYPRLTNASRAWFRRRCLSFALARVMDIHTIQ